MNNNNIINKLILLASFLACTSLAPNCFTGTLACILLFANGREESVREHQQLIAGINPSDPATNQRELGEAFRLHIQHSIADDSTFQNMWQQVALVSEEYPGLSSNIKCQVVGQEILRRGLIHVLRVLSRHI